MAEDQLRRQEYISYREFQLRHEEGWFEKLRHMTRSSKMEQYGAEVAPVFAPLRLGETTHDYEKQFATWLRETHHRAVEDLGRLLWNEERSYRLKFAWAKFKDRPEGSRSRVRSRSRDSSVRRELTTRKRAREDGRAKDFRPGDTAEDSLPVVLVPPSQADSEEVGGCGSKTTWSVSVSSSELSTEEETNAAKAAGPVKTASETAAAITNLVLSSQTTVSLTEELSQSDSCFFNVAVGEDPIKMKLWAEYDVGNEQVTVDEAALENSTRRLLNRLTESSEIQQVQSESESLRASVQASTKMRTVAAAVLVVYLWRHDVAGLKALIQQAGTQDSAVVQRVSHNKCADWARVLT